MNDITFVSCFLVEKQLRRGLRNAQWIRFDVDDPINDAKFVSCFLAEIKM